MCEKSTAIMKEAAAGRVGGGTALVHLGYPRIARPS